MEGFADVLIADDGHPCAGFKVTDTVGGELWGITEGKGVELLQYLDHFELADFAFLRGSSNRIYWLSSSGVDTRSLFSWSGDHGLAVEYSDPDWDVDGFPVGGPGVWFDPQGSPCIVSTQRERVSYAALTDEGEMRLAEFQKLLGPEKVFAIIELENRAGCGLIAEVHDDGPLTYVPFVRETTLDRRRDSSDEVQESCIAARKRFVNRPELVGSELSGMEHFWITSESDDPVLCYRVPAAGCSKPAGIVIRLHGGPGASDFWHFDFEAQIFSQAGFDCIMVNYRGSSGRGKRFRRSGMGQWGPGMLQGVWSAVAEAKVRCRADGIPVVIQGHSFGGYLALIGASCAPNEVNLRCVVAINPMVDLGSFLEDPPPRWRAARQMLNEHVFGSTSAPYDHAAVANRSPVELLNPTTAPIILALGTADDHIRTADVDDYVDRARAVGVSVEHLRLDGEGHVVALAQNRIHLYERILAFIGDHLTASQCPN
ncbi:MAG TPA: alpha/beta fold hydrolase [Bryobacteraceae bacterium]